MDDKHYEMEVADEQARNQTYQRALEEKVRLKIPVSVSRSARWTGTGLPVPVQPVVGPLIGRVGLAGDDPLVGGRDFYIGPWHSEKDGVAVFSWAAPIASAFYADEATVELDHAIAVRRTMQLDGPDSAIIDFIDDWLDDTVPDPFAVKRGPAVPRPPSSLGQPIHGPNRTVETPVPEARAGLAESVSSRVQERVPPSTAGLRAERAVRAALAAPRSSGLKTLLGTLQPDQYDYVTRPGDVPLVVQGHPGTGKTVIAAHRAAFLVHPERTSKDAMPRVLLVGPNVAYTRHVREVLQSLVTTTPSPVVVMGVPQLLQYLRDWKGPMVGSIEDDQYDVSLDLGMAAEAAAFELRNAGVLSLAHSTSQAVSMVYAALKANQAGGVALTDDEDLLHYLRQLPQWKTAESSRRFLPLLAQCATSIMPPRLTFDHVIVDEAQDVRPLEWQVLKTVNRGGAWTILGDMNQRRSDWSYHSWNHLVDDLDLVDDPSTFEPEVFRRGYRSTAAIIGFANRLLPKGQRELDSIQTEGPPPTVTKTSVKRLTATVIAVALDLQSRYPTGATAIITLDGTEAHRQLMKHGWTLDQDDKRIHRLGDKALYLLLPDGARGLEFDAVVVVEPADFPPNLGRMGSLYTSLTRANRELCVVHTKPLPDGLSRGAKRASMS